MQWETPDCFLRIYSLHCTYFQHVVNQWNCLFYVIVQVRIKYFLLIQLVSFGMKSRDKNDIKVNMMMTAVNLDFSLIELFRENGLLC